MKFDKIQSQYVVLGAISYLTIYCLALNIEFYIDMFLFITFYQSNRYKINLEASKPK